MAGGGKIVVTILEKALPILLDTVTDILLNRKSDSKDTRKRK